MSLSTGRSTAKRTLAAAAAVAAASTLAACGSESKTAADAPSLSSSTASSSTSSTSAAPKATPSTSSSTTSSSTTAAPQPSATTQRASRSQVRAALPTATASCAPAAAPVVPVTKVINWTQDVVVPNRTVYVYSDKMDKGTAWVSQKGQKGLETVTYATTKRNGVEVATKVVSTKVTRDAVRRVITLGSGVKAPVATVKTAATATPKVSRSQARTAITTYRAAAATSVASSAAKPVVTQTVTKAATVTPKKTTTTTAAAGGSSNAAMWNNIASCESTNNWSINTGNGFYGGLQFTQQTWAGFGGTAYAPRADLATKAQQMAIADKVLAVQGRGAWPVCGK